MGGWGDLPEGALPEDLDEGEVREADLLVPLLAHEAGRAVAPCQPRQRSSGGKGQEEAARRSSKWASKTTTTTRGGQGFGLHGPRHKGG